MTTHDGQPAGFAELLARIRQERLDDLARRLTARSRELGLTYVSEEGETDIPATLTPETISSDLVALRGRDAQRVLAGVIRTARILLGSRNDAPDARNLFARSCLLDAHALVAWREAENVTIARVDWFLDAEGRHHAIELNADIPAGQGFTDAAAIAWLEVMGDFAGLEQPEIDRLIAANGSNVEELRRSIVAHSGYREGASPPSIAIVHRDHDANLHELDVIRRHFEARGHDAVLATPDRFSLSSDGRALVGGRAPQLLYRHIDGHRIPEGGALESIALGHCRQRLQNPVNRHLNSKSLFAEWVRLAAESPESAGVDSDERDWIRRAVPWTRVLARGPGTGPDGGATSDLAALVEAAPDHLVLKRSWGQGGQGVVIGRDLVAAEGTAAWKRLVRAALAEGRGAWVVQELVAAPLHRHLLASPNGRAAWEEVFVDASTFTASGDHDVPRGGCIRFAPGGVVNVMSGGGIVPLVRDDVAHTVRAALERLGC